MGPMTDLSNTTTRQLIQRAQEIIAGREKPPPIIAQRGVGTSPTRGNENARGHATGLAEAAVTPRPADWLNLQAAYGGRLTACFTTADGVLAVLAWGEDEVGALIAGLTDAEREKVVIEFPDSPVVFVRVAGPDGRENILIPPEAVRVGCD